MVGLYYYDRQYQKLTDPVNVTTQAKVFYASTLYPWAEPVRVRINPRLAVVLMTTGLIAPNTNPNTLIQNYESRWHYAWSEPVRVKQGLGKHLQQTFAFIDSPVFQLDARIIRYLPWSEPLYPKKGLKQYLQQTSASPPRLLPPISITVTMSAHETNTDTFSAGIDVSNAAASAKVTIREIEAITGAAASIEET